MAASSFQHRLASGRISFGTAYQPRTHIHFTVGQFVRDNVTRRLIGERQG